MKFKISKRSLIKNRLIITVTFYLVALYISILAKVVVPFLIIAIMIPSSYYAYKWNKQYKRRKRILASGIFDIDKMAGQEFEVYLEELFRKKGCSVERTPASGDFGADLIIDDGTGKTAIQAKRYSDKVGLSAVQEVVGAMAYYSCKSGMVVTNSSFTEPAKKLAASNGITLWSRDDLVKEIIQLQKRLPEISLIANWNYNRRTYALLFT